MHGWAWTIVLMAIKIDVKKEVNLKQPLKCKESFSERNGLTEVKENDSNDTLVPDDNAHKVNLHTRGYFFCMK